MAPAVFQPEGTRFLLQPPRGEKKSGVHRPQVSSEDPTMPCRLFKWGGGSSFELRVSFLSPLTRLFTDTESIFSLCVTVQLWVHLAICGPVPQETEATCLWMWSQVKDPPPLGLRCIFSQSKRRQKPQAWADGLQWIF